MVAQVGDNAITLAEVDQKIRLERHDLAIAEYELRFNTLKSLVEKQLLSAREAGNGGDKPTVDWLLPYPQPPRLTISTSERRLRGNPDAPVILALFCSYQSVHCASTNLVMRELLNRYAGWLSLVPFDFPMHYHRQGKRAAQAARCAGDQAAPWSYADGLYARAKTLEEKSYPLLAIQQGFHEGEFTRCLKKAVFSDDIEQDIALARDLGLQSVPVSFVNGLYIKGPKTLDHYAMWVDQELLRLGHDPASPHPQAARWRRSTEGIPETELPLELTGTSVASRADQSSALIRVRGAQAKSFTPGDTLMPAITLERVHERHVILDVDGRRERLMLRGSDGDYVHVPKTGSTERDEETLRRIEQPEGESRKLVAPSGVLPLGQQWLQEQLRNREDLEQKFVEAELVVDGYNLLRLEGIESNEFFTALGFEEGDVVVRVNDTWVHSGQNQLWDALTSGEVIDVTFMRNGLPQRLQYVVEDKGYFEQPSEGDKDSSSGDSD
ncbi:MULTISPECIES: thioredoxin domain-containing protein [Microbulbifer]|uniref:thioredoxin domain-containing protein n=1 Tax=Microbulbifer TaxID=48073 RepID=UPI0007476EC0|nr:MULTISPECIES: thioredoxin domain-containing protein [Microbulbifer]KUJ83702.1 hypothetical protein AVO43_07650 [Microbulbifer sp. ZGT114]